MIAAVTRGLAREELRREQGVKCLRRRLQDTSRTPFRRKPLVFRGFIWGRRSTACRSEEKSQQISTYLMAPRAFPARNRRGHERGQRLPHPAGQGQAQQGPWPPCTRSRGRGSPCRRAPWLDEARRLGRTASPWPVELRERPHRVRAQPPVQLRPACAGEGTAGTSSHWRAARCAIVCAHRLFEA